jgi:prepilin-type N-terminal cleavage/methylation domain-containing protein
VKLANSRRRAGFTLVEVMIVVAIISLLAALSIPSLKRARERAQAVALAVEFRAIRDSVDMYWAEHNKPTGLIAKYGYQGFPDGMNQYFPKRNDWLAGPRTGGYWLWYFDPSKAFGYDSLICIYNSALTTDQMKQIDATLDDGNLSTGTFTYVNPYVIFGTE